LAGSGSGHVEWELMRDRTNKDLDPVPRKERKWGVGSESEHGSS
jgi:hypothetical protein